MLYIRVCDYMRLEEKDYFGLMFVNNENHQVCILINRIFCYNIENFFSVGLIMINVYEVN